MKKTFLVILVLVFTGGHAPVSMAQQQPAQPAVQDGQNVEVLINTMNEVLEENRRIRKELEDNADAMQKLARENKVLRTELNSIKGRQQEAAGQDKQKVSELEVKVQRLEESLDSLQTEKENLEKLKAYHDQKVPELEKEVYQLNRLLDSAVLEGEREEYLALIENAQAMASQSFNELSASKRNLRVLEEQTAEAQYELGNLLFDMKDYKNAISSYEKALEVNPRDPWIHHNLAVIYDFYIHDDPKALYHYKEYLQLKPVSEEAHEIRERILELELKKNMIPEAPLQKDFYENYTKEPR